MMNKVLFIVAGAFIILAVIFLLGRPTTYAPTVTEITPDEAIVELDTVDSELNTLDSELEQLDADTAGL